MTQKQLTPTQNEVREMYPHGRYMPESERRALATEREERRRMPEAERLARAKAREDYYDRVYASEIAATRDDRPAAASTQELATRLATQRGDDLIAYRRVDARFDLVVVLLRDAAGAFALGVLDENRQTINDVQPLELATPASLARAHRAELGNALERRHAFERTLRGLGFRGN